MNVDELGRLAMYAFDPAALGGLSAAQRDSVVEAIRTAWQASRDGRAPWESCESAIYPILPAERE